MQICPVCKSSMKQLLTSLYCPNDLCGKAPAVTWTPILLQHKPNEKWLSVILKRGDSIPADATHGWYCGLDMIPMSWDPDLMWPLSDKAHLFDIWASRLLVFKKV